MGHLIRLSYPGAANGTWSMTTHADSSLPGVAFVDWECQTATAVRDLNQYGAASFYVNELVDVVVRDFVGVQVDAFTDGYSADAIEVISPSFTGTNPVTGQQAANQPLLLSEALDRLRTSFGTTDFKVFEAGLGQPFLLKDAITFLRQSSTPEYNVKAAPYNAVGDSVADDTTSIQAAIDAASATADGGVVLLPAGQYACGGTLTITNGKVSIRGEGSRATTINSVAVPALSINHGSALDITNAYVADLNIGATAGTVGLRVAASDRIVVRDCTISGLDVQSNVILRGCELHGTVAFSGGSAGQSLVEGCQFGTDFASLVATTTVSGGGVRFAGSVVKATSAFTVSSGPTVFEGTTVTTANAGTLINVTADVPVMETGTLLTAASTKSFLRVASTAYASTIISNSRRGRAVTKTGTSVTPDFDFETNFIDPTGNLTINAPVHTDATAAVPWNGCELILRVRNNTGGAITVTLNAVYHGATANIANPTTRVYHFVFRGSGVGTGWYQIGVNGASGDFS